MYKSQYAERCPYLSILETDSAVTLNFERYNILIHSCNFTLKMVRNILVLLCFVFMLVLPILYIYFEVLRMWKIFQLLTITPFMFLCEKELKELKQEEGVKVRMIYFDFKPRTPCILSIDPIEVVHMTYNTVSMADCSNAFNRSMVKTYHYCLPHI